MILDTDDLTKVLRRVVAEEMPRAFFTASMALQQKNIRYFPDPAQLVEASGKKERDGGLSKEEHEFYRDAIARELHRQMVAADTSRSYHVGYKGQTGPEYFKDAEEAQAAIAKTHSEGKL